MSRFRRSLWLYPLFQIPLIFLGIFLIAVILCWLLGLGRPTVSVAIAVDMSNKTYQGQSFNAPNTIMAQELSAVRAYLDQNFTQLKNPNQVQIFGFGERVIPLTNSFTSDRQKLESELNKSLANPTLALQLGSSTNLEQAIDQTTKALTNQNNCRDLLIITNNVSPVSPAIINQALTQKVKINAVVVGADISQIQPAAVVTRGLLLSGDLYNLQALLLNQFFPRINSNVKWIILFLGGAWISLMWTLTLPLDRWLFQGIMKYRINISGLFALGNALFWTIATPLIVWGLWQILGLPFFGAC